MANGFYVYGASKLADVRAPEPKPLLFREAMGMAIRQRRLAKGLGLRQFAKMASYSPTMISEVERGLKETSSEAFAQIAATLEIGVSELVRDAVFSLEYSELSNNSGDELHHGSQRSRPVLGAGSRAAGASSDDALYAHVPN